MRPELVFLNDSLLSSCGGNAAAVAASCPWQGLSCQCFFLQLSRMPHKPLTWAYIRIQAPHLGLYKNTGSEVLFHDVRGGGNFRLDKGNPQIVEGKGPQAAFYYITFFVVIIIISRAFVHNCSQIKKPWKHVKHFIS